jgi:hypothetical protein
MTAKEKMVAALTGVEKKSLKFVVDKDQHTLPGYLEDQQYIFIRGSRGGYKGTIFIEHWNSGEVVFSVFHSSGLNSTGPFGKMFRSVDEKRVVDYINKTY